MLNYMRDVFRLFVGGYSAVRIMSRRMRNYSVIMISELVNYVGQLIVTDKLRNFSACAEEMYRKPKSV